MGGKPRIKRELAWHLEEAVMGRLKKSWLGALVRFECASRFRVGARDIGDDLARLYYATDLSKAVEADVVRALLDRGLLASPAAGQLVVTEAGRRHIDKALGQRPGHGGGR